VYNGFVKVDKHQTGKYYYTAPGWYYTMRYPELLAIVIPYRGREEHLNVFLEKFPEYVRNNEPELKYKIIIAEQPYGLPFIRSLCINVGAMHAKDIGADNIFIHDVDMIPVKSNHSFVQQGHARIRFPASEGSSIVHTNDFFASGGYNNEYVGWGGEDDEFYMRLGLVGARMSYVRNEESLIYESLKHDHQLKPNLYGRNSKILQYYMNSSYEIKKHIIATTGIMNMDKYIENTKITNIDNSITNILYSIKADAYSIDDI
jgi:hypothetical protein